MAVRVNKKWVEIDGKAWSTDSRFEFSSVTPETKFILINDVTPTFEFSRLFNLVTDSMTIEGKGTNKKEIPADKSPKIAISTNEVIAGTGGSYKRRQHIVEFGNFWNRVERLGEKVSDPKHIGKSKVRTFVTIIGKLTTSIVRSAGSGISVNVVLDGTDNTDFTSHRQR